VYLGYFTFSQLGENLSSDNIGAIAGEMKDKSFPGKNEKISALIVDGEQQLDNQAAMHFSPGDSIHPVLVDCRLQYSPIKHSGS